MSERAKPSVRRGTTRRRFLGLTAGGLAALALLPRCGGDEEPEPEATPEIPDPPDPPELPELPEASPFELDELVQAYFGEGPLDDVRAVGAAWTRGFEDDRAALTEELAELAGRIEGATSADEAAGWLVEALAEDFDQVRLADVGGWLLGQTEARMAGLAYAVIV